MRERIRWLCIALISLGIGAICYCLCRTDTWVGAQIGTIIEYRIPEQSLLYGFMAWYLPDYLWVLALTSSLFAILLPRGRKLFACAGLAAGWGLLWELGQLLGIATGTADLWDSFLYIMAAVTAVMIEVLTKRRKDL